MMKIGIGYDVHSLVENRKLILGGIEIPYEKGLLGHSDADVLIHAIIDAILGAMNKGSIGDLFPDTDKKYKNISSLLLLKEIKSLMNKYKYSINNIDTVIVTQEPKLQPYILDIQAKISSALETDKEQISIKATTTEYLGFTGRKEGIAAYSVVLLNTN